MLTGVAVDNYCKALNIACFPRAIVVQHSNSARILSPARLTSAGFLGQGADLLETRVWDALSDRVASYSASRSFRTAAI